MKLKHCTCKHCRFARTKQKKSQIIRHEFKGARRLQNMILTKYDPEYIEDYLSTQLGVTVYS